MEGDPTRPLAELEKDPSLSCWYAVYGRLRGKGWRGHRLPRPHGRGAPHTQRSTCLPCSGSSLAPSQAPVLPLCLTNIAGQRLPTVTKSVTSKNFWRRFRQTSENPGPKFAEHQDRVAISGPRDAPRRRFRREAPPNVRVPTPASCVLAGAYLANMREAFGAENVQACCWEPFVAIIRRTLVGADRRHQAGFRRWSSKSSSTSGTSLSHRVRACAARTARCRALVPHAAPPRA
jgi:hypothetical protein